ncbi:HET-domain-containing protein [Neofusicoccum parvum]|uniref:HET-domain-containing protein, partial n=1 Tax=Neofusicoccum parvum TaxID=310453 RepID=A0ACB5SMR9_9PEZI|nr:HET-domain-containing protein [Neofusicoccum parvum]
MGLKEALLPRVSLFSRLRSETISEDGDFHHDILDYKQKSIPVLKILPSRRKTPVRCVLEETTIGRAKYTCLSYRWGDRGANNPTIEVNCKTFHVHQNLFDFLKVARQSNRRRTYWIDAICIDQQNIHEKNHQVRLMGEIYKHAEDVVLWLGEGDQVSEDVIAFINSTRDYIKRTADVEKIWENLGNRSWDGFWEAYAQVCKNEYWRRAWIVQEVVLARQKTILQGDQTVNWPTFVEFWNKATTGKPFQPPPDTLKRLESSPLASIVKIAGTENSWKPKSLVELLPTQGLMHCTRVQDRIYSLLPLCIERDRLLPDYDIDHLALLLQTIDACKRPSDSEAPPNVVPFVHHLVKILELWESDLDTLDEDKPYIEVAAQPGKSGTTMEVGGTNRI